jgi:hypothetical protein
MYRIMLLEWYVCGDDFEIWNDWEVKESGNDLLQGTISSLNVT